MCDARVFFVFTADLSSWSLVLSYLLSAFHFPVELPRRQVSCGKILLEQRTTFLDSQPASTAAAWAWPPVSKSDFIFWDLEPLSQCSVFFSCVKSSSGQISSSCG
jgi:hypothetical protein